MSDTQEYEVPPEGKRKHRPSDGFLTGKAWELNRNPIIQLVFKALVMATLGWISTAAKQLYELRHMPGEITQLQNADVESVRDRAGMRVELEGVKRALCWEVFTTERARFDAGCPYEIDRQLEAERLDSISRARRR